MKIQLSTKQIKYIMAKVAMTSQQEAIEYFAQIMMKERIDPKRMSMYVSLMMSKDGVK